jgi:hypothetical protein
MVLCAKKIDFTLIFVRVYSPFTAQVQAVFCGDAGFIGNTNTAAIYIPCAAMRDVWLIAQRYTAHSRLASARYQ